MWNEDYTQTSSNHQHLLYIYHKSHKECFHTYDRIRSFVIGCSCRNYFPEVESTSWVLKLATRMSARSNWQQEEPVGGIDIVLTTVCYSIPIIHYVSHLTHEQVTQGHNNALTLWFKTNFSSIPNFGQVSWQMTQKLKVMCSKLMNVLLKCPPVV